jgi:hypothetical protein
MSDVLVPVAADGGGDVVMTYPPAPVTFHPPTVAVRPAGGTAAQPAPVPDGGVIVVSAPVGRRVAVVGYVPTSEHLRVSVWRP